MYDMLSPFLALFQTAEPPKPRPRIELAPLDSIACVQRTFWPAPAPEQDEWSIEPFEGSEADFDLVALYEDTV